MSLQIECSRSGEQATLYLEGRFDSRSPGQLISKVLDLINTGCSDIWLNFESVSDVSVDGVQGLVSMDAAMPSGAILRVTSASRELRRELALAGLEHLVSGGDAAGYELDLFGLTASAAGGR